MSFDLTQKIKIVNPHSNIDELYGVYNSVAEALTGVPLVLRQKGRTVGVLVGGSVVEYWFKDGITDADLVLKGGDGDSSNLTLEQARLNGNVLEGVILSSSEIVLQTNTGLIKDDWGGLFLGGTYGVVLEDENKLPIVAVSSGHVKITSPEKGIIADQEFDKQGDRKAFAQLSDVEDAVDNYIPLSGTEEGKPVTGDIEVGVAGGLGYYAKAINEDDEIVPNTFVQNYVSKNSGNFGYLDTVNNKCLGIGFNTFELNLTVSDDIHEVGLQGKTYYGENYNDDTYIQKKYADQQHSYSTEETKTGGTWIDGKPIYTITKLTTDTPPSDIDTQFPTEIVGDYTVYKFTKTTD